jgi:tRNA A37 methylthiotransferase MiaB
VKRERLARLFEVVEAQGAAHLARLVGTQQRVLVEGASKSEKGGALDAAVRVQGRTERNEIVHVEAAEPGAAASLVGSIVEVEVVRANRHSLTAVPTAPVQAAGLRPQAPAKRRLQTVA